MKIINKPILYQFSEKHSEIKEYLMVWLLNVAKAKWIRKEDILNTFPKAELLDGNKIRFPIIRSDYFIIADIHYSAKIISIKFIESKPKIHSILSAQSNLIKEATYAH